MKKTPIFTILCITILAAAVVYFAVQAYRYVSDPLTTTLVYQTQVQDTIEIDGYMVRSEETFHSDARTLVHSQTEGARVGVGQVLAVAYPSDAALETVDEVEQLELQLEQLQFALDSYLDSDAALKLDSTILEELVTLRRGIAGGDYADGYNQIAALESAVMKRSYSYTSLEQIEADIMTAKQQLAAAKGKLSGASYITAPYSGTYSAVCDGYETVLTTEFLSEISVSALENVKPAEQSANVGKLISGDTWYYACILSANEAQQLDGRSSVTVHFAKGLTEDIRMCIERITPEESGRCVLILSSERYLAQTTLLRHQSGELVLREYEGLRVPANALRVSEDGTAGVYCITGATARFKPVEVVWQGDGYVLVKAASTAAGTAQLRIGDEVIATSGELHDGKVVS